MGEANGSTALTDSAAIRLGPGQVAALIGDPGSGLTRVGLSLIADRAEAGRVACLDVRGWLSPLAAWEIGIPPDRLLIARCRDAASWGRAAAALLGGVGALYAEVPWGVGEAALRKLGALARQNGTPLVLRPLRGDISPGIASLRLVAGGVSWTGLDHGHGHLERRQLHLTATGKVVHGMTRSVEAEDDGANAVRMVPGLATAAARRLA